MFHVDSLYRFVCGPRPSLRLVTVDVFKYRFMLLFPFVCLLWWCFCVGGLFCVVCFGGCLFCFFAFSSLWNFVSIFNLTIKGKKSNVSAWFLLCVLILKVHARRWYS